MSTSLARYYDKIYSFKNYSAESVRLRAVFQRYQRSRGNRLLDVACGTGGHLAHLRQDFEVVGLDLSAEQLEVARERLPGVPLHQADMTNFDLGARFDVVICLFSSIGYVRTHDNMARAIACMAAHLEPGGVLVVEPWDPPEEWGPGTVHAVFHEEPELKLARIANPSLEDGLSVMSFHYLIGTPAGTEHHFERHELGLFSREQMTDAMVAADLEATYVQGGLTGMGLQIGRKPL